ncbi:MAG: RES family NAD+ phosphorylase [Bacteroidota bacterium]|nr:RES domain-containing protein [Odoribacter sp.]MDP3645015.1 RES family NAD+ phosphorylase [Bacteroidota bacterium]
MFVYRITKKEHSALDGMGGMYGPGRWHEKGNLVIYTSEHASLAAWEKIVHVASFDNLPDNLLLVKVEIPDGIEIQTVPQKVLVKGWNSFPFANETVNYGTSFLRKKVHLALKVPSVIIPDEHNIILNPLHPDIQSCKIISTTRFIFDMRVFKEHS